MATTDQLRQAHDMLDNYFGADKVRREKCLLLAKHAIWTTKYHMLPPGPTLDLVREVFPVAKNHVEMLWDVPQEGLEAVRTPALLLQYQDLEGSLAYLAAALVTRNPEWTLDADRVEGLNEMLIHLGSHIGEMVRTTDPSSWTASYGKAILPSVIKAVEPLIDIAGDLGYPTVIGQNVASGVYKNGDLELFEQMLDNPRFSLPNRGSFVVELDDMWRPAKVGNIALQQRLIGYVEGDLNKQAGVLKTKFTMAFWRGVDSHLNELSHAGNLDDWREIFRQATKIFNTDSLPNPKALLTTKQMFPMLLNIAKVGQRAKDAGIEISYEDLRLVLKPLELAAKETGRMYVPYMGADYEDMKDTLSLLLKDVSPADFGKRPLPKHLASALSDMTENTKWIGKATLRDRGRILSDDLGL